MCRHSEEHLRRLCPEGTHKIKHWPSPQKAIALGSGEAELAGAAKRASEGLGLQSIRLDLGRGMALRVFVDPRPHRVCVAVAG